MYSWGSDTSNWKAPGGYSYKSTAAPYLKENEKKAAAMGPKEYVSTKGPDWDRVDPKDKHIVMSTEYPVGFVVDGTGSMRNWPKEIHDRSALFAQTVMSYKPTSEILFSLLGDAGKGDKWPAQVGNPGIGPELDADINALYAEGRGGGNMVESYELLAHFYNNHVETPNAISPTLFFIGDEGFYDTIDKDLVKEHFGDDIGESIDSKFAFSQLTQRWDVWHLHKPYHHEAADARIVEQWREAIGPGKVIPVYNAERFEVIDVALGILAKKWGYESDFLKNLEARQDSKSVASVMMSLKAAPNYSLSDQKSAMVGGSSGALKSSVLIDGEDT